ncbi:hypothetical protein [Hydrogenophaga sp.]|uniref:hypothetical protein n=1 Tax=Hydrogenophaga sp. TaxID=1904254 RepID=UPI001AC2EF22|nr:hypothetical protein [Hydrogenophaga sp.]MBN9372154.1 hypothetical protein [Hydrogenophaga sp.]
MDRTKVTDEKAPSPSKPKARGLSVGTTGLLPAAPLRAVESMMRQRLAKGVVEEPDGGDRISFADTKMEVAAPWTVSPSKEQFSKVAAAPGPFPEPRDKDL